VKRIILGIITSLVVMIPVTIAPAAQAQAVRQTHSVITIGHGPAPVYGVTFAGKVTTPGNAISQKGRVVILYDTSLRQLGSVRTGTFPGHSPGYWRIQVADFKGAPLDHFSAYVLDFYHWGYVTDDLPAQSPSISWSSAAVAPARGVRQTNSVITIGHGPDVVGGSTFVGKVTAPRSLLSQKGRTVILYDASMRYLGSVRTGTFPGHSSGYWSITVAGWAGISLDHFSAYTLDSYHWGYREDDLPAQSALIGWH